MPLQIFPMNNYPSLFQTSRLLLAEETAVVIQPLLRIATRCSKWHLSRSARHYSKSTPIPSALKRSQNLLFHLPIIIFSREGNNQSHAFLSPELRAAVAFIISPLSLKEKNLNRKGAWLKISIKTPWVMTRKITKSITRDSMNNLNRVAIQTHVQIPLFQHQLAVLLWLLALRGSRCLDSLWCQLINNNKWLYSTRKWRIRMA